MARNQSTLPAGQQPAGRSIGRAAELSGVSAKMIRHYERIGLLPRVGRTLANYRIYREADVHTLRFIKRARGLGFSVKQIGVLLDLWRDRARASADVKRLALAHVAELEARIRELGEMCSTLRDLADHCRGDRRPACPILEDLAAPAEGDTGLRRPARMSRPGRRVRRSARG